MTKKLWTRMILITSLAGLLIGTAGSAGAARDYRESCRVRLEADRTRIDHDASRFGERSRQVDRDVAKMDSDRQWCRTHKADWDHSRFDIGIYFRH